MSNNDHQKIDMPTNFIRRSISQMNDKDKSDAEIEKTE
jgi:hypothetical protein